MMGLLRLSLMLNVPTVWLFVLFINYGSFCISDREMSVV